MLATHPQTMDGFTPPYCTSIVLFIESSLQVIQVVLYVGSTTAVYGAWIHCGSLMTSVGLPVSLTTFWVQGWVLLKDPQGDPWDVVPEHLDPKHVFQHMKTIFTRFIPHTTLQNLTTRLMTTLVQFTSFQTSWSFLGVYALPLCYQFSYIILGVKT